jgi:O-antigen/teichoic acid export membrane protein
MAADALAAAPADAIEPAVGAPRRLARNVGALAGGQAITWTVTLLWTLVVPRVLGPAGLGLVVSAMSVSGVLGIVLGLGTRNYLVREIVVDPAGATGLVGTAVVLRVALAPLVAAGAIAYALLTHQPAEAATVLYLAAAAAVLTLLAEPMQAAFQAMERMHYLALSDVINKSGQSVLGIAVALAGLGAVGVSATMAAVAGAVIVVNAIWLRRYLRIDLRTTLARCGHLIRESFAYWAFGVFGMVYLWIDAIMLSLMTRPEVVGWYGAPTRIFQTLMFVPVIVSTAWLPRLVAAFTDGNERLLRAARAPIELVLVLSLPIAAGTAMVARPLIHGFYGAAYDRAVAIMVILALTIPPIYLNIMLSQVLLAAKRQVVWTWVMVVAAFVNPACNLVLIPAAEARWGNGAIGASVSLFVTEAGMCVVGLVLVGRRVFDRRTLRRTAAAAVASGAMWGVAELARPLAGTLPSLVAGGATFLALAVALRIATPGELGTALRALRRRRAAA